MEARKKRFLKQPLRAIFISYLTSESEEKLPAVTSPTPLLYNKGQGALFISQNCSKSSAKEAGRTAKFA